MIHSTWSNYGNYNYKLKYSYIQYSHMCLQHLIWHNIFSEQSTKTTQKPDPQYVFVHVVLRFIEKAQFSHLWLLNNVLTFQNKTKLVQLEPRIWNFSYNLS